MIRVLDPPACPRRAEVLALLSRREDDAITREESRLLSAHVSVCEACAREAFGRDPTLLFASIAGTPAPEAEARQVAADVLAAVELERSRRRLTTSRRRNVLRAASIALVGAGLLGLAALKALRRPAGERAPEISESSSASEPGNVRTLRASAAVLRASHPLIEGLKSPAATVYQFAGRAPDEPTVVFVVDRNADL